MAGYRTLAATALLGGLLLGTATPAEARRTINYQCHSEGIPTLYDVAFQRAAKRYLPTALKDDWCLLKALCWVESRLKPGAESHVGAIGLCQIMPATIKDFRGRLKLRGSARKAKVNAELGAAVLAHMLRIWHFKRPWDCRMELGAASYNAGPKNIIDAQKLSGGRLCWDLISGYLHEVTGHHARETIAYVLRFWRAYRRLRGWTIGS